MIAPRVNSAVRPSPRGYVRSFTKRSALAIMLAAGLSQAVAMSQSLPSKSRSSSSKDSAQVRDWANRVTAKDPKVRASAEAALVKGAERSLPLLRRFLTSENEDLHEQTFEIIRQIGLPAIPLLVELLRDEQVPFRRFAADALIDLAPDTESIQPALRRALRDEDSMAASSLPWGSLPGMATRLRSFMRSVPTARETLPRAGSCGLRARSAAWWEHPS